MNRSVCGYCSTGCSLGVRIEGGEPLKVEPVLDYPVNVGKACPKGYQFLGHLNALDRATTPQLRDESGVLRPVSWPEALEVFVGRFKDILRAHGPDSVAVLGTGQITNEEVAYLGALSRFGMGLRHCDGNTRQCMASAAVAYRQSLGFDAPPFTYRDLEESDVLVFVGGNPAIAHPILWQRVKNSARAPRVVVIDPRATETAAARGVEHYRINPKTDLVLFYGLGRLFIAQEWLDREFVERCTEGFEAYAAHVAAFGADRVARETGLTVARLEALARIIHQGERVSFWWTMGVNQGHEAVRTAQAIIDLALLIGAIGRPGTGPNSITGQCNAMGSRLFSNTASLFCGRDFSDPEHRAEVAAILDLDEGLVPTHAGMAYDQILEAADAGRIKGLWIVCTNPIHSWPDRNHLERTLRKLDFLVVQDMFHSTDTAGFAHLVLPAAGCGEKEGTFINSERRIGVLRAIAEPPGEALPDLQIFQRVAEAWGCGSLFSKWTEPEAVFRDLARLSEGRPCDFSGVSGYEMVEERGGIQWPYPWGRASDARSDAGEAAGEARERRLFEDGHFYHPSGRARFLVEEPAALPEPPDDDYPFVLLTGRGSVYQWHTLTRTDKAALLRKASPDPAGVQVNPIDAARLRLHEGMWVEIRSRRGSAWAMVRIAEAVTPGQVFIPMHNPHTNRLTLEAFDPYSRQPVFKSAAVAIVPRDPAAAPLEVEGADA